MKSKKKVEIFSNEKYENYNLLIQARDTDGKAEC